MYNSSVNPKSLEFPKHFGHAYIINHVLFNILIMIGVGLTHLPAPWMVFMHDTALNVEYHTISTVFVALN